MPGKRKLDVAYPVLEQDRQTEAAPDWRSGTYSDWRLILGPRAFSIHRVIVGRGERRSAFLDSAFTTAVGAGQAELDLSKLLPEAVWNLVDEVLDFIYVGKDPAVSLDTAVSLLVWADALQMEKLFKLVVHEIDLLLTVESAPRILEQSSSLLGKGMQARGLLEDAASICVAEGLAEYSSDILLSLPDGVLSKTLGRDCLGVSEQSLHTLLKALGDITEDKHLRQDLWRYIIYTLRTNQWLKLSRSRKSSTSKWAPIGSDTPVCVCEMNYKAQSRLLPDATRAVKAFIAQSSLPWPSENWWKYPQDGSAFALCSLQRELKKSIMDTLQNDFVQVPPEVLCLLPDATLDELLRCDTLKIFHEDEVFETLKKLAEGAQESRASEMWRACRIGALSPGAALEVASITAIPPGAAYWAALHFGRVHHPVHPWVLHTSLRPRRPYRFTKCLFLLGGLPEEVRTDREMDNIEYHMCILGEQCKYEFLIRMASELRRVGMDCSFEHINDVHPDHDIDLDECEVVIASSLVVPQHYEDHSMPDSFVAYKPFGSNYPRKVLQRLQSYLDRCEGALVILPGAGGLCPRGPDASGWRAGEYEPMYVGSYLATDIDGCGDDLGDEWWGQLNENDITTAEICAGGNPRLFAGVEHIRGPEVRVAWGDTVEYDTDDESPEFTLRNYPSKMVRGAIVHAHWLGKPEKQKHDSFHGLRTLSPPQPQPRLPDVPFVVEHPTKPVLSVFFGGTGNLFFGGSYGQNSVNADDRLQLVLNCVYAMALKGKEFSARARQERALDGSEN